MYRLGRLEAEIVAVTVRLGRWKIVFWADTSAKIEYTVIFTQRSENVNVSAITRTW